MLDEAREFINRALGGISTLNVGPIDYNVSTTIDDLRVACRMIEEAGRALTSQERGSE